MTKSAPFKWEIHCPLCGQFLNRWKIVLTNWNRRWSPNEGKWVVDPSSKFESDLQKFESDVLRQHLSECDCREACQTNDTLLDLYILK